MVTIFAQPGNRRFLALMAFESIFIAGGVAVSTYLLVRDASATMSETHAIVGKGLLIAFVFQLCLYYGDLYEFGATSDRRELFARILKALGISALILATIYFWFPALSIGQGVVGLAVTIAVALVIAWRITFAWVARRVAPQQRFLIIGTNASAINFARELQTREELGIEIVGFINPDPAAYGGSLPPPQVIGVLDDIPRIVREHHIDRVVVSLADARGKLPMDALLQMRLNGVLFDHLASVYEQYTGKIAVENLRPSWLIFAEGFRKTRRHTIAKRVTDIFGAVIALVALSPVMLLVAIAVRLTSPGPVLYHQRRVGRHGLEFALYKFRSMRHNAEAATGPVWAQKRDVRVTPIGAFLRRTRLDELPQLWNILRGEMSIVGPRPERPEFVAALTEQIPFYAQRLMVKPGLSGWAQVRYVYGASVEDAMEKLQYDLFYIKHMSIVLDVMIMLETVKTVLLRRGT